MRMLLTTLGVCTLALTAECTHIFGIDKDFNKVNVDPELLQSVEPIVARLKMFKVAVHPRIGFFYGLLRRGMARRAAARADSLYVPDKYTVHKQADAVVKEEGTEEDEGDDESEEEDDEENKKTEKEDEKDKDDAQKDKGDDKEGEKNEKKDSRKKGHIVKRKGRKTV